MTNQQFADRVGCHHSLASRLRAGKRVPGIDLINRIHEGFGIPIEELVAARNAGPEEFGRFIRRKVFNSRQAA